MTKVLFFLDQPKKPILAILLLYALCVLSSYLGYSIPCVIAAMGGADIYENMIRSSVAKATVDRWSERESLAPFETLSEVEQKVFELMRVDFWIRAKFMAVWVIMYLVIYFTSLMVAEMIR